MNVAEQTELYAEYIECVRDHNEANDTYSSELNRLADERARAMEAAIAQHMTPLINFLNMLRVGGIVGLAGAGIMFCITATAGANQLDKSFLGTMSWGFVSFLSFVVALICLGVVAWTSSKVGDLENRIKQARASKQA